VPLSWDWAAWPGGGSVGPRGGLRRANANPAKNSSKFYTPTPLISASSFGQKYRETHNGGKEARLLETAPPPCYHGYLERNPSDYAQAGENHAMAANRSRHTISAVLLSVFSLAGMAVAGTPEETAEARRWVAAHFGQTPDLPVSFLYDGKPSAELLKQWEFHRETQNLDDRRMQHTLRWRDVKSGLELRCVVVEYLDFPTAEWTLYFKNTAAADTPILEKILALDAAWQRGPASEFLLHHAVGSPAKASDYGPLETPLPPTAVKRIAAAGGRPTNSDWSYFNIQWGEQGVILAVGWPGQWAAEFVCDSGKELRVRAGQEVTHFKLLADEEVRSPLIALQFWKGDRIRSQNIWRRWMAAHSMPKPGGKLPPPQFVASSSRAYGEMIGANEANQIMHIHRYQEEGLKLDYWWMDAGWYIQQHGWPQVGTWEVDPQRFPHGFRPISDYAHARGTKILVWFEPERVVAGTWLYEHHPEWLLSTSPGGQNPLAGMRSWSASGLGGSDPCVTYNSTSLVRSVANIHWDPGRLALHPGPKGEYSVVRWTAPDAGEYSVRATFLAIDRDTTTDVHVLHRGRSVFDGLINLHGQGKQTTCDQKISLAKGDTLDFVVGWGNGSYTCDSTGLEVSLKDPTGRTYDPAKQYGEEKNPIGLWSYGFLKPGPTPDAASFHLYDRAAKPGDEGTRLLDLGNPAARQWLTEHVDKLLTEQGIDLYRQDFNVDPLAYWRAADAPDRQGITEIKHVTGYLAYWDELRHRHPDMLIDSCASGGRRNDLETMRRAVPLWRSDYAFEPIGHQGMTYGISLWLPYHGTGTVACSKAAYYGGGRTPIEPYAFWSNTTPSLGCGIDIRVKEIDYRALRRLVGQWRTISQYYYGDYYPLTPYSLDKNAWIAWQFDCPERGEGMIQAFRRDDCPDESIRLKLHGLEASAAYAVTNLDTGAVTLATGRKLLEGGLAISLQDRPAAAVLTYRRTK
jgi:alpha-galactosidase